jgi:hypothetical protein
VGDALVGVVVGVPAGLHAVAGDVYRGLRTQRAGEHPDQGHPAHVRVDRGLDHLGHQGAGRVAAQRVARFPTGTGDLRQVVLQRRREPLGQYLQQRVQPDAGLRAHRDHREEAAARDRLLQVLDDHLGLDGLAGQIPVHEALVLALGDDAFEQFVARVADGRLVLRVGIARRRRVPLGVVEDALRDQADQADHRCAVVAVQRQVQRENVVAEHLPALGYRVVEVGALVVQPGDRDRPGHADRRALLPERAGGRVHAVHRRDHEQRGVGRAQPGA